MNPSERAVLDQFLQQLTEVKLTEKDSAAESLIQAALARQPDAAYLLVQRSLLQDRALQVARAQIADLQNQLQQQKPLATTSGFLQNDPWEAAASRAAGVPGGSNYRLPPTPSGLDATRLGPQTAGAGFGSGLLSNVASTATGVVAGSFLFQGIESLLGHHQAGLGQQASGGQTPEQTVINHYYSDEQQSIRSTDYDYSSNDGNDSFFDGSDAESDWI